MVKKAKKMMGGGAAKKAARRMRGGGAAKAPRRMRGGGATMHVSPRKAMGMKKGGVAKKMMRGGKVKK